MIKPHNFEVNSTKSGSLTRFEIFFGHIISLYSTVKRLI
jgi:hypothetical protein